jgi:hypothetical protein
MSHEGNPSDAMPTVAVLDHTAADVMRNPNLKKLGAGSFFSHLFRAEK